MKPTEEIDKALEDLGLFLIVALVVVLAFVGVYLVSA